MFMIFIQKKVQCLLVPGWKENIDDLDSKQKNLWVHLLRFPWQSGNGFPQEPGE
jgi:hypothetical protein